MDDLLYTGRNTALTILPVLTVAPKLRSLLLPKKTAPADVVDCNFPRVYTALSVLLVLSYLLEPIVFSAESLRSSGKLPDNAAAVSNVAFLCCVVLRLETASTRETAFSRKAYATFWLYLLLVELASSVRVLVRPSLPSLYAWLLFSLPSFRAISCLVLFVLLVHSHRDDYTRVLSDPEDANSTHGDDNGAGDDTPDDVDVRRLVEREVEKLGGRLPYLKSFRVLLKFTWPSDLCLKARFVITFVLLMAERIIGVVQPLQTARLIDAINSKRDPWTQFAVSLFLRFLRSDLCLGFLTSLSWVDVDLARRAHLKTGVQSKVMLLDYFHMRSRATDTITAIDNAGQVDKLLDNFIFGFLPNAGTLFFAGYGMWERFGTSMMLILVCMSVAYYCCERKYVAVYLGLYSTFASARDSQERRRQDGIRGWITVSAHNMVGRENELYAGEVNELMKRLRAYKLCGVFYTCIDELILQLADGLGWALVILRVLNYEATIGSLTAFLGLWNALMEPISFFKSFVTGAMEELSDMVRLKKLMEENPRIQDGEKFLRPTNGQVRLENVSFAYSESKQASLIVNNLSLTIEGGTKVAFVGPSGTGKSTILKLVLRQLLPTEGCILIDGQDIAAVSKDSLHNAVGMMVQDPHIFDRTVLFNIRYAKPDATIDEVHAACKSAGIHETIMGRPGGYDALTGANGANFSGGERQRLLLARLFLVKPKIVLIDEGTSALDSQTESNIKHSISREFPSSTVIIIAHRLSSIRNADRIIVLDHGCKIVEDGTHDNLVAQEGEYAGFWKMHLGIEEDTSTSETPLIDIA